MAATDWEAELTLVNEAIAANLRRMGVAQLTDRSRQLVQQSLDELNRHRDRVIAKIAATANNGFTFAHGVAEKQG